MRAFAIIAGSNALIYGVVRLAREIAPNETGAGAAAVCIIAIAGTAAWLEARTG